MMVKFVRASSLLTVAIVSATSRPAVVGAFSPTAAFVASGVSGRLSPFSSSSATSSSPTRSLTMKAGGEGKGTTQTLPIKCGEEVMSQKAHGTSDRPVMKDLKWGCDWETADRICNFNRHYAEFAGYWQTTKFLEEVSQTEPTKYYDSVTGNHLFTAPVGRTMEDYLLESQSHGWPSFRDDEVNWDYVRCLDNGECVSITGTHLGHNIPDSKGNRYCINLVSVAGRPKEGEKE